MESSPEDLVPLQENLIDLCGFQHTETLRLIIKHRHSLIAEFKVTLSLIREILCANL
jgi:hypothetical protein